MCYDSWVHLNDGHSDYGYSPVRSEGVISLS